MYNADDKIPYINDFLNLQYSFESPTIVSKFKA